jgi:hypothetical protein
MATITLIQGTRTSLTVTGFSTLASATYVASSAFDAATDDPLDVLIEVEAATTNTPGGNKQVVVFVQASLDGTNFQSGPTSGTTTTDEADLTFIGVLPMNTTTTTHRKVFSIASSLGFIPVQFKVILKNDLGVALTSGAVYTAQITGASA